MPQVSPRQSLSKAFLKQKPLRQDVLRFRESVTDYLRRLEAGVGESEEHHKNLSKEYFLRPVLGTDYDINTSGRADLVVRGGPTGKDAVKVLLEYKSPRNAAEMPTPARLDGKATRELLLYYLRERETRGNLNLTQLVVTNGQVWFVWDAQAWERAFHDDKALVRQFRDFEAGVLSDQRTQAFYREIAGPVLAKALPMLDYTYVDLRDLPTAPDELGGEDADGGRLAPKLLAAYKLFTPTHLLKLPFANDSNQLNKHFYHELLYLLGLEEREENNKRVIGPATGANRQAASLLELTREAIQTSGGLARVPNRASLGGNADAQASEVALALVITWINRVLFCKLLEGQLLSYHEGDPQYAFMSAERLASFDDLAALWFGALAVRPQDRSAAADSDFPRVPYLNSSLFEPTELERQATQIGVLRDGRRLPCYRDTVLKDRRGQRRGGEASTLGYLLEFLAAYEFASEAAEGEVLDQPRGLINASVLGLIFEKINGYKEGSFYTPGFVTEYMCRETIRDAIVHKFKNFNALDLEKTSYLEAPRLRGSEAPRLRGSEAPRLRGSASTGTASRTCGATARRSTAPTRSPSRARSLTRSPSVTRPSAPGITSSRRSTSSSPPRANWVCCSTPRANASHRSAWRSSTTSSTSRTCPTIASTSTASCPAPPAPCARAARPTVSSARSSSRSAA